MSDFKLGDKVKVSFQDWGKATPPNGFEGGFRLGRILQKKGIGLVVEFSFSEWAILDALRKDYIVERVNYE